MKAPSFDYEKTKKLLRRMLCPGWAITLLISAVSAAGLTAVFMNGWEETILAYIMYPLSAWALTALIVQFIPMIGRIRRRLAESALWKYAGDARLRENVSMISALSISLFYAVFKLTTGCLYRSPWLIAVAIYYAVLAVMRFLLMKNRALSGGTALRVYRLSGALMILLALSISGMAVQMVRDNRSYSYPGVIIFASAAYTFYSLTMAVLQVIRCRHTDDLMQKAVRTLTFCTALMALFALQTGLIEQFGSAEGDAFRMTMNALTGGFVCLTTLLCGIFMLRGKTRTYQE